MQALSYWLCCWTHWHFHLHIDQYLIVAHLYKSIELTHEAPVTVVLARM